MRVKVREGKGGGTVEALGGRKIRDGDILDIPKILVALLGALVEAVAEKKSKE